MALEGCLEDLGIRDILQILSLSKKSGTLSLKCQNGSGVVYFSDGQVVRATSNIFPETLGQLLRQGNVVTEDVIVQALKSQKSTIPHRPLGQILVEDYMVSSAAIEKIVAAQIEKIIFSFFSCNKGSFSFQLGEMEGFGSAQLNPLDFMLEQGLSPQRLVVKGLKVIESGPEKKIDQELIERELAERETQQTQSGLERLRGMLAELEHYELGGGIILLILRYASEIMGRAIIFDVRGSHLVGVGQFGLADSSLCADSIVRKMQFHIDSGSLFAQVIQEKVAVRSALKNTAAEESLKEFLNGEPEEVFLGPLVSDGKVVALLYGDSGPGNQVMQDANAFEVFLSQAGLAMEQTLRGAGKDL
ncbi:protein of unknown function [Desulfuromusa kysingii]|uniref:PatA-like N-terminal domain-containing protein n=1 Tax=Desulfuromusa kysingii TaxID=37625 RepID=A0A1H4BHH4_9BACT|nr:DUF4388 domain-containing protein [Desulfuromusa kysingii]SEA47546.1 protein of unknown function [Desulfuromusa kysingii]